MATQLVENGIDAIIDQWDVRLGSNLLRFMEQGLTNADRVLVICTDNYIARANAGQGGVGYETNIVSAELVANQGTSKFIPCIRNIVGAAKTPACLTGRAYIDFSDDSRYEQNFKSLLHELHGVPERPKPQLGKNPLMPPAEERLPSIGGEESTVFFSTRFARSFPGARGIQWFRDPFVAMERLRLFFTEPFVFRDAQPIWWWRDGNMSVDRFQIISPDTVLIDHQELVLEEMAAVNAGSYYQTFIYIRTGPSTPSGLNDHSPIHDQIAAVGYAREEFALFRDRPVTRAEYDDGAAVIDGQVIELGSEACLRVRYLSPYNLLLAPHSSPVNNSLFDLRLTELLNGILRGEVTLEQLTAEVLKLPKLRN